MTRFATHAQSRNCGIVDVLAISHAPHPSAAQILAPCSSDLRPPIATCLPQSATMTSSFGSCFRIVTWPEPQIKATDRRGQTIGKISSARGPGEKDCLEAKFQRIFGRKVPRRPMPKRHSHTSAMERETQQSANAWKTTGLPVFIAWQGQRDSNPRPSVLETDALPTELYPFRQRTLYWESRTHARGEVPPRPQFFSSPA